MKYFHELTNEEIDSLVENKKTWWDIKSEYKQPDWCNYPDALNGVMGCWSLIDLSDRKVNKEFCKTCELCINA